MLIDCGKTFRESALKWFPKKGLRKIDAVILTRSYRSNSLFGCPLISPPVDHHADATDGLDDLRAWTYKGAIEESIPIYCTQTTFNEISKGFAYLVSKAAASGSGAVPTFNWKIFEEGDTLRFREGVEILTLPVHHGIYFTSPPTPLISLAFLIDSSILYCSDVSSVFLHSGDI